MHMKVVGVTCTSNTALLAGAEDGDVVRLRVEKIEVAHQYEASSELEETQEEIGRAYAEIDPDLVVILKPEPTAKWGYDLLAPRVALETLMRLAAVEADIDIDLIARATVRARLGLAAKGKLASHVAARIPEPVGPYWAAGRDIAALAALAGEAGG